MSLFSEIEKTIERGFHRFTERMFGPADSNELLLVHRRGNTQFVVVKR